ncbi:efflux RND transporter periplasmic adaptor subunit [Gemmatimonadota bacterium]
MSTRNQIVFAAVLVAMAAMTVGFATRGEAAQETAGGMEGHDHSAMTSGGGDDRQPVSLDGESARRIGVTYATVVSESLVRHVRTVGIITFDETRITAVSPKIEGWVENLHVDFTGAPVQAGQPLLDVYSPALVTAQEELILAGRLLAEAETRGSERARENARELLESARRRLSYWDIPADEIAAMEERGTVTRTVTLRAPSDGIVVEKKAVEGGRFAPGMEIYRVADLSRVWVEAEVFERDLAFVGVGQHAHISLEAYPGEMFHGMVNYVYPTVSADSRAGRVRVELANPGLRLRPGMYAGLHFEIASQEPALLVPRSSVLFTGERSVVFVRSADGTLLPRDVEAGASHGDRSEIVSGLEAGEVVVSSATFLIDAESNLGAAMEMLPGMETGGMDHSQHQMPMEEPAAEVDHSQHQMPAPDTAMVDHSGYQMTPPDTTGAGHEGHSMPPSKGS